MRGHLGLKGKSLYDKFKADKEMIRILDEEAKEEEKESLHTNVFKYIEVLKKFNFRDWVFKKPNYKFFEILGSCLLLIVGFPLYLFGLINNYLPYKFPTRFTKNIKDPQFHSSFKYAIGVFSFIIYYLIILVLILIFIEPWWLKLAYLILIKPSGKFAYKYYIFAKKLNAKIRYNRALRNKNKDISGMVELRSNIVAKVDKLVLNNLNK
jgi:hypothetical protein